MDDLTDIPAQIFQIFLKRLEIAGVSADVVERLLKAATDGQPLSESALRGALFSEDDQTS